MWEHSLTRLNIEAGEDIRWLPRHRLPEGVTFSVRGNDWWGASRPHTPSTSPDWCR
ncbi:DUF6879 family protein [Streptomyces sp. NBC_00444]|uniref:DUF6879 family protein n=1 Tax=Streptomyces sp. NBC_00444 TaxID=2975744 RepID=UPI002E1EB592|nr:DUF6879 family protein [Streptomyces sp. NBC_00444]